MIRTVLKVKNDKDGWALIKSLRLESKIYNLHEKAHALSDPSYDPVFKRVVLFGRLGKNNPNRSKYSKVGRSSWSNPAQRISLQDAAEIAVYINPMRKMKSLYPDLPDSYHLCSNIVNVNL